MGYQRRRNCVHQGMHDGFLELCAAKNDMSKKEAATSSCRGDSCSSSVSHFPCAGLGRGVMQQLNGKVKEDHGFYFVRGNWFLI